MAPPTSPMRSLDTIGYPSPFHPAAPSQLDPDSTLLSNLVHGDWATDTKSTSWSRLPVYVSHCIDTIRFAAHRAHPGRDRKPGRAPTISCLCAAAIEPLEQHAGIAQLIAAREQLQSPPPSGAVINEKRLEEVVAWLAHLHLVVDVGGVAPRRTENFSIGASLLARYHELADNIGIYQQELLKLGVMHTLTDSEASTYLPPGYVARMRSAVDDFVDRLEAHVGVTELLYRGFIQRRPEPGPPHCRYCVPPGPLAEMCDVCLASRLDEQD